jgi:putative adenylate-forming enzyme
MTHLARVLWSYWATRRLRFDTRASLERHQQIMLRRFIHGPLARSPYFSPYRADAFETWPIISKSVMMSHFDSINTAGLRLADVLTCAMHAEHSRDFTPTVTGYSVGLSSGTSGSRGVFVVSREEQAAWAGVLLARLLPRGIFAGERVALFLRANNNLYGAVRTPWLTFEFFDLLAPMSDHLERLERYAPTIIVGPAQVLRALAELRLAGRLQIAPRKVLSGAEVLEAFDRALLEKAFGSVGEVYQATEGFLGATCSHGTLHLNEAHLLIEPQWLDQHRFVPLVTDFSRRTQPIVRYRLDDILIKRATPCPCGSHEMALAGIEGRCDDMLKLPGRDGTILSVFADGLSRAIAQSLSLDADYRLIQTGASHLTLLVDACPDQLNACRNRLEAHLARQRVDIARLQWTTNAETLPVDLTAKRRRIVRHAELAQ